MFLLCIFGVVPFVLNQMKGVTQFHFSDDWCDVVSNVQVSLWYPNNKCVDFGMGSYQKYYYDGNAMKVDVTCSDSSCTTGCTDLSYTKDHCYQPGGYMFKYGALNRTIFPSLYFEYTYQGENCVTDNLNWVYYHPAKCAHAYKNYYSYYECEGEILQQVFFNNSNCDFAPVHKEAVEDTCKTFSGWPTSSRLSCKELV